MQVRSRRWRNEAGQVFVLFALALPVLLGLSAIVVDVGGLFVQKRTLQSATDAAALAAASDLATTTSCTDDCIAALTRRYSGLNTGPATLADLTKCPGNGSCYTWPYVDPVTHVADPNRVEVKLKRSVPTLFARVFGISKVTVSARAVAGITPGAPPPYSFVALNSSNEKHTLLVKLGGQLNVTNAIYVNSSSLDNNSTSLGDAFDIFGAGGNIAAPSILVHGGWETHDGSTVTVNGELCVSYTAGAYKPEEKLDVAAIIDAPPVGTATTFALTDTRIKVGEIVQIDSERMLVTAVTPGAHGSPDVVTATRGYVDTTPAVHALSAPILLVAALFSGVTGPGCPTTSQSVLPDPFAGKITTPTGPTASCSAPCRVPSGTITLQPGTYNGGICIGEPSGTSCQSHCKAGIDASGSGHVTNNGIADVTLVDGGTYIMAGGGFWVCGRSILRAPHVMIYNTNGSVAVDQIELNTEGSVTLGPSTSGPYQGLTIFQNKTQAVQSGMNCDHRDTHPEFWDIALLSMASTGANGALGSISGTIYAPHEHAVFGDSVSGIANLAVITGCIYIDGGNSTFDFQGSGLFGIGSGLSE